MRTCTFHAFAKDVLEHYGQSVGVTSTTSVIPDPDERREMLARGLAAEGIALPSDDASLRSLMSRLLDGMAAHKRSLVQAAGVPTAEAIEGIGVGAAYGVYDRVLRESDVLDFDDLLLRAYRLFNERPRVARHYRATYRYIVVDEAQDTSRAQYALPSVLCGTEHRNVMMVADEDQSIFRYAGADPQKFLRRFVMDFDAREMALPESFRCGSAIVEVANRLIRLNDPEAPRREMRPASGATGHVEAYSHPDEVGEADGVRDRVLLLLDRGLDNDWLAAGEPAALSGDEICVIARTRAALKEVVQRFHDSGIEHTILVPETELFESRFFGLVHCSLRAVANPRDVLGREAFAAALAERELGPVEDLLDADLGELLALLQSAGGDEGVAAAALMSAHQGSADVTSTVLRLKEIVSGEPNGDGESTARSRDALFLTEQWGRYRGRTNAADQTFGGLLAEIALAGRRNPEGGGVRVRTVHTAKGLEFRVVFIIGMAQRAFPDFRSLEGAALEEERRNAYVAATRAGRLLVLTLPRARQMPWGDMSPQAPSQFIAEMGLSVEAR